jgi:phosphate binding protein
MMVGLAACGRSEEPTAQAPAAELTTAPVAQPAASELVTATEGAGAAALPEVNPLEVTGAIISAGSSTVYPLAEAMAERFADEGYAGNITIDSVGTGGGFERFCKAGETDIANASRPIREEEIANCAAINRTPLEFRVGTDGLAVVVSAENDFVTSITLAQLAQIFSDQVTTWDEVDPSWPAEPIQRFSPGTDSGTFDFFVEAVMAPAYAEAGEDAGEKALLNAANLQLSEDDNVLVQGVEGSPYAIGYFGYAFYEENADRLKVLPIDGVEPDAQTVEDGSYALARPLFIYSDAGVMKSRPQVAAFISFFLTYVNEEITDIGYFPASAAALDQARQAWLAAMAE